MWNSHESLFPLQAGSPSAVVPIPVVSHRHSPTSHHLHTKAACLSKARVIIWLDADWTSIAWIAEHILPSQPFWENQVSRIKADRMVRLYNATQLDQSCWLKEHKRGPLLVPGKKTTSGDSLKVLNTSKGGFPESRHLGLTSLESSYTEELL